MKAKLRLISYARFCKKIIPIAVRWHRQQWSDNVTSEYYGRYAEQPGAQKDIYYLQVNKRVYVLNTVEELVNLDHDLYLMRMKKAASGGQQPLQEKEFNYCSICAHKDGCPFLSFAYTVRKKACLFIPVFHLTPTSRAELENMKSAEAKLIMDVVMSSLYAERAPEHPAYERCTPIAVYKHTFTFSQLQ